MRSFTSVPCEIRAEQFFPPRHPQHVEIDGVSFQRGRWWVRTIHGQLTEIREGDWAVQEPGYKHEDPRLYPITADIFARRYTPTSGTVAPPRKKRRAK